MSNDKPPKPDAIAAEAPAEAPAEDSEGTGGEGEGAGPPGKLALALGKVKKHLVLILIVVVATVTLGVGGWVYVATGYFTQAGNAFSGSPSASLELPGAPIFQDLEQMVVDLRPTKAHKRPFIRFTLTVEFIGETSRQTLLERETKIRDAIQVYLRTVTLEELSGEAGANKLRDEMVGLINSIMAPDKIITVLFKDIIVR